MLCQQFSPFQHCTRPSPAHFRAILFPHEGSTPILIWAEVTNSNQIHVSQPSIQKWKTTMAEQYKAGHSRALGKGFSHLGKVPIDLGKGPLVIHALSRDARLSSSRLGHGLRIVSYAPPEGERSQLSGVNNTIRTMFDTPSLTNLLYGPVIAFAYKLDKDFEATSMDDVAASDFGHVVGYLANSRWSPAVGNLQRFPHRTVPALFIPDGIAQREGAMRADRTYCSTELAKRMGFREEVMQQNIPARINNDQCLLPRPV